MQRQRAPSGNNQEKLKQAEDDAKPDLSLFDRIRAVRARQASPPKQAPASAGLAAGLADGTTPIDRDYGGSDRPRVRGLNGTERAAAESVFGSSLDYDAILISPGFPASEGYLRTIGSTIAVPIESYIERDAQGCRTNNLDASLDTLMHELTHVWQYQHTGPGYVAEGLATQAYHALVHGDAGFAYSRWMADVVMGVPWAAMNVEAQGDLVEYYFRFQKMKDQEIAAFGTSTFKVNELLQKMQPYIDLLRAGKLEWDRDFNRGEHGEDLDTPMWDI